MGSPLSLLVVNIVLVTELQKFTYIYRRLVDDIILSTEKTTFGTYLKKIQQFS